MTTEETINQVEKEATLKELVIKWAGRTPIFDDGTFIKISALIERSRLPELPNAAKEKMSFNA